MAISTFRRREEDPFSFRKSGQPATVDRELMTARFRRRSGQPNGSDGVQERGEVEARESLSGRNAPSRGAPSIMDLMNQRREGAGLYSRTNVGTQATARQQANDAGTFARAVDPQGTLEGRPDPSNVRDPFIDNATRRGIRSSIEDQNELRQDLISGSGMNPVEYRAGLQALQATNQGLQPLMDQRTATDTAEMQEIGATNRQLLGIDNTRMQGAMNLAQQAMQGDQQMDLARLQGGLSMDETLLGAMGDREAAAIEGAYNQRTAAVENSMSPLERLRYTILSEASQGDGGGMSRADILNASMGEPLDTSPEDLIEVQTPEGVAHLTQTEARRRGAAIVGRGPNGELVYGFGEGADNEGPRSPQDIGRAAADQAAQDDGFLMELMGAGPSQAAQWGVNPATLGSDAGRSAGSALRRYIGLERMFGGLDGTFDKDNRQNRNRQNKESSNSNR